MTEWLPINQTIESVANGKDIRAVRWEVASLIMRGMIKAKAFRSQARYLTFSKSDDLEIFGMVANGGLLDDCNFPFPMKSTGGEIEENAPINSTTLLWVCKLLGSDWHTRDRPDYTIHQVKADWERGHFHERMLSYTDEWFGDDDDAGFRYSTTDLYSVEIEADAMHRFFGFNEANSASQDAIQNSRPTSYDWEAAFADVAAKLYSDLAFDDVNARGVQKEIINALRQSFEERKVAVPSDDTLKPKARKIVGALRAFRSK